jgi:RNA polymerase primary sigma factor
LVETLGSHARHHAEEAGKEPEGKNGIVEIRQRSLPAKPAVKEPAERTDDPVRMYFGEMRSVELLSREDGREARLQRFAPTGPRWVGIA